MAQIPSLTFEWYKRIKDEEYCRSCNDHPIEHRFLHFHHVNPRDKISTIYDMVYRDLPKKQIIKEMDKCVVLCEQCHQDVHAGNRSGWLVSAWDNANIARKFMPYSELYLNENKTINSQFQRPSENVVY